MHIQRILLLFLVWALSVSLAYAADKRDYQLGAGDVIKISVYDHPDLSAEARVSEDGAIQYPLLGDINLRGLTSAEAADRLAKALETGGFIKQPQVTIVISQFRGQQISVLGFVARPGKYPIERISTVSDLIAVAGGLQPTAGEMVIFTSSDGNGKTVQKRLDLKALFEHQQNAEDPAVKDGDMIYVPREDRYYIYGEVQRPGAYRLEPKMTVMQALAFAGGVTLRGTQNRIKVNRRNEAGELMQMSIKLDEFVKPDDVVFISESLF